MVDLLIPDSRLLEVPELLYPGRMPIGLVSINPDHSMAPSEFIMPQNGTMAALDHKDIVTSVNGCLVNHHGVHPATTGEKYATSQNRSAYNPNPGSGARPWSITVGVTTFTDSGQDRLGACSLDPNVDADWFFGTATTLVLRMYIYTGNATAGNHYAIIADATTFVADEVAAVTATWDGIDETGLTLYKNGIALAATVERAGTGTTNEFHTKLLIGAAHVNTASKNFSDCIINYLRFDERELNAREVANIHANPYQFLVARN